MTNKLKKIDGVILKTIPFQDHHLIITVFSFEEGVLQMIGKGFAGVKNSKISLTTPFTRGEFVYAESRGDLQKCREISLLDAHFKLRGSLKNLEAAGRMIKALLQSQLPGKPAPDLYRLLLKYLQKIPEVPDAALLGASFLLKILLHDGLVDYDLDQQYPFTYEEWGICKTLALSRSFTDLCSAAVSAVLHEKIDTFFLGTYS